MCRRKRMLGHRGKHWTIDCGYTELPNNDLLVPSTGGSANTTPAFLIRPISRNSLRSNNGQTNKRPLSVSPNALSAAIAAASATAADEIATNDISAGNYLYRRPHGRCKLKKDKPFISDQPYENGRDDNFLSIPHFADGNDILKPRLHLQRQHSDAGAYGRKEASNVYITSNSGKMEMKHKALIDSVLSSRLMKPSHSHPGIAMLRDNSCSLVDIPTYLAPSLQACGGVEVLTVTQEAGTSKWTTPVPHIVSTSNKKKTMPTIKSQFSFKEQSNHPSTSNKKHSYSQVKGQPPTALSLDIDYREKQILREKIKLKKQRKAKCTVLCVSLLLLTMCVTLVGTMLSIGSKYQVIFNIRVLRITVFFLYYFINYIHN